MFELINRILGKDKPDWNGKLTDLIEQAQKNQENKTSKPDKSKDNKDNTTKQPTHKLNDYVGVFTHPGYGTFEVTMDGDHLRAHFGTIHSTLSHKQYDLFQFPYQMVGKQKMMDVQFKINMDGNIEKVAVSMELPEPIVFSQKADK
jgi:hypothetical protein